MRQKKKDKNENENESAMCSGTALLLNNQKRNKFYICNDFIFGNYNFQIPKY